MKEDRPESSGVRVGPDPAELESRSRLSAALAGTRDFLRRLFDKAGEDDIFFLAGAISFNVLIAFVPLVLAVLGIAGTVLRAQGIDSSAVLVQYVGEIVPAIGEQYQLEQIVVGMLETLIAQSTGLLSVGTVILAWVATRLIGTLRTVLREIFDIHHNRGIVAGKLFDLKMVLVAGTFFTLSVGGSFFLQIVARHGFHALGLEYGFPAALGVLIGEATAFLILWGVFLLIYRYLPARPIGWRTCLIAASTSAVFFELLKRLFSWYATTLADYTSTYGTFAFAIVLILWIYYSSVVFVLGGQVAQVVMMGRTRRRQKERLG